MAREKVFSVRLDELSLSEMEAIAEKRGVMVSNILREWIDEQLLKVDSKDNLVNLIVKLKSARDLINQAIGALESKPEE